MLKISTCLLVFTSASGCRASKKLKFIVKIVFPYTPIIFCDAGQVSVLIYFVACSDLGSNCFAKVISKRQKLPHARVELDNIITYIILYYLFH